LAAALTGGGAEAVSAVAVSEEAVVAAVLADSVAVALAAAEPVEVGSSFQLSAASFSLLPEAGPRLGFQSKQ